jgi:hypothetical protein
VPVRGANGDRVIFVRVNWAEAHHDVHVADGDSKRLGRACRPKDVDGIARFNELVGAHATDPTEVVIGIETDRGCSSPPWSRSATSCTRLNRSRRRAPGSPFHHGRRVDQDLGRAHQSMVWSRGRQTNALASTLREFYPAGPIAFEGLASPEALDMPRIAPTPTLGAGHSRSKIAAALRGGRPRRRIDQRVAEIQVALRTPQLRAPVVVATARGASVTASVVVIAEMVAQTTRLAEELSAGFEQHPKSGKNCAGRHPSSAPRALGGRSSPRHVRNRRLADAI